MTEVADDRSRSPGIGLALGGGAALGLAHVGVLAALRDADIRITQLSGTSAGAVVAALHAFGVGPDRIHDVLAPLTWRSLSRHSRSRLGLRSNEPLGDTLRQELGDASIENAAIPLAIVAADIHTGERVVLTSGPVDGAVRASTAIPGIFTPVRLGDRLLVDGGVVENVPVQPLRRMGSDVVVAVMLGSHLDFQPVRNVLGVLANAFLIAVNTATRANLAGADVVIAPELAGRSRWSLAERDELIRLGYEAGVTGAERIRVLTGAQPYVTSTSTLRAARG